MLTLARDCWLMALRGLAALHQPLSSVDSCLRGEVVERDQACPSSIEGNGKWETSLTIPRQGPDKALSVRSRHDAGRVLDWLAVASSEARGAVLGVRERSRR